MPKNIVATPAAVVAVDRLALQVGDARGDVSVLGAGSAFANWGWGITCFSEE